MNEFCIRYLLDDKHHPVPLRWYIAAVTQTDAVDKFWDEFGGDCIHLLGITKTIGQYSIRYVMNGDLSYEHRHCVNADTEQEATDAFFEVYSPLYHDILEFIKI